MGLIPPLLCIHSMNQTWTQFWQKINLFGVPYYCSRFKLRLDLLLKPYINCNFEINLNGIVI